MLRRHIKVRHGEDSLPPSRAAAACTACRGKKERCQGGIPCDACRQRGSICLPAQKQISPTVRDDIDKEAHGLLDTPIEHSSLKGNAALPHLADMELAVPHTTIWAAQVYIDKYFAEFHPQWPFLHRSTFNMATEPCVLIQSVLAIGLWIEGSKEAREASDFLERRLHSAIQDQRVCIISTHLLLIFLLTLRANPRINGANPILSQGTLLIHLGP